MQQRSAQITSTPLPVCCLFDTHPHPPFFHPFSDKYNVYFHYSHLTNGHYFLILSSYAAPCIVFIDEIDSIGRYVMTWYDMIWYDMIWYDMIWYDMIWYASHHIISYHIASHHITPNARHTTLHNAHSTAQETLLTMIPSSTVIVFVVQVSPHGVDEQRTRKHIKSNLDLHGRFGHEQQWSYSHGCHQ